jgi:hypothetical protein
LHTLAEAIVATPEADLRAVMRWLDPTMALTPTKNTSALH